MSELKLVLRKKEKENGPAAVNTAAGQPRLVVRNKVTGAVSPVAQNTGSRKLVLRQTQSGIQATAQGLNDLMGNVSSFLNTVSTDFAGRDGKYQNSEGFNRYKADALAKADGYAARITQFRDDLSRRKTGYEAAFGAQTVADMLKWLDDAEGNLGAVRSSLENEGAYWENFADEAAYNKYVEVEQLAGKGTETLTAELDAVNASLTTAAAGMRLDGDSYRRNPGQRGQMAQSYQQAAEEQRALTERKQLLEAALKRAQIRETDSRYEGQDLDSLRAALSVAQQDRARAQERAQYLGSGAASRQGEAVTQMDIDAAWAEHERLAKKENELKQVVERRFPTYYADLQQATDFAQLSKVDHGVNDEMYRAVNGLGSDTGKRTVGNIVLASKGVSDQEKKEKQTRFLENMTADEVGTYNYIYKKFGAEEAQDYLDRLEETVNERSGKKTAKAIQDIDSDVLRWGATMLYGMGAGVDSFVQGTRQNFRLDPLPTSATQYASQELMQDLGGFNRVLYSGLNTVGNMLPSILLGKMTGGLGGATLGKLTGAATMGLSASGNAYKQAMLEGYDGKQAQTYSVLVGASEATLQYLIGGIGALGGVSDDVLLAKAAKMDGWFKKMVAIGAIKIGSEVTEEEVQLFLEPAIKSIVMDIPYDAPNFDEMMETAFVTALSTFMLEGKSIVQSGFTKAQTTDGTVEKPAAPVKADVEPVTVEGQTETAAPEVGTAETDATEDVGEEANPADAIPDESVALPIVPSSDPKVQREFNRAAKIADNFGCKLVVGMPEGGGEGSYLNGVITINPNSENPVMQVLLHELTHRLENSKQYSRLTELVRRQLTAHNVDVETRVQEIVAQAEGRGESMTPGYAMRELVAQYVQTDLFQNEQEIQRLLREERSVFDAIRDWLNDAVHWLKGNLEQKRIIRAQRLFEKALRTSDPKMGMSGAQHLIETGPKGKYVKADRQVILGNDPDSWRDQIEVYINQKIRRGEDVILTTEDGLELQLTKDTEGKASFRNDVMDRETGRKRPMTDEEYLTKLNAEAHIDELALISKPTNTVPVEDEDGKHGDLAENGWYYRTAFFQDFDGKYYRVTLSVPSGAKGFVVYNVGEMRERSLPTSSGSSAYAALNGEETSFEHSIRQDGDIVNRENSPQHPAYYDSMADVQEGDWRPLQKTEDVDGDDTSSVTADAAQGEGVEADPVENLPRKAREYLGRVERVLTGKLGRALSVPKGANGEFLEPIVRYMSNEFLTTGKVSRETVDGLFDTAYRAGIEVEREYYDTYKFVRDHIKQQAVTISKEDQSDIPDFAQFKKSAADVLKIRKEGGLPVDVAYQELRGMAPELFPESITHPAEQLMKMHEVAKGIEKTEVSLDQYYGDDAATFKEWAKRDFDVAVGDMLGEMRAVMRYAAEQTEKRAAAMTASEDEVRQAYNEIRNARKTAEKAVARNLLTDYDNAQVGRLLKGEIQLEDLDENRVNVKGIREVFEAKQEYEKLSRVIREYQKRRRGELHEQADGFLGTANSWKDKPAGFLYARETMERNIRDIVEDDKLAKGINDTYFKPVHDSQAESNRFKNRYRDRVRKLDLSRKAAKGNEVSEAYAVQLIGEAEDNIRVLEESRGRLKSRDGKTAAEWRAEIRELWEKNPELDRAKIEGAVQEFRAIYDELFQQMNEVRLRNGYEPVAYRRGYFPHFQAEDGGGLLAVFGKVLGIETAVTALPTSINGITHTFRPGITWFGNAQERLGYDTVFDAVQGFDKYIEGAADVIHQTDNIQRLRALSNRIRYRASSEGIRKQVDEVMDNKTLTEDEKQKLIQQIYADGKFSLSNFVVELEEYTNILANKKSLSDRNMERLIGRRMYNVVKALESRVAANMVAINPGSWLTNFIPLTQASAEVGTKDLLQAMWGTLQSYKTPDGLVERSTFLTNRRGSDVLVKDWSKKSADTMSKPMELIDRFTADSIVRARYAQNLRRGMSEAEALADADAFAAGVIADRSKGAMPTIFNRANPVTKLFTQFQLEVNNQFSYLLKDIPRDMRDKGLKALAGALLKFFLGAWLYNEVYEHFIGRRPALDPIGMLNDTVGDLSGWELPNLVELGVGAVTGDLPSFRTEKTGVSGAGEVLAKSVAEELPFIGGVLGGGRVPISSALPDGKKLWNAATNGGWSGKKRWTTAVRELAAPVAYLAPPFGGGQAKKVLEGVEAVVRGGSYSVDTKGNANMQYPVYNDTVKEWLGSLAGAATFGKTSLPTAREWVESGFDGYNTRQTEVYRQMNDAGVSDRDAHQLLNDLEGAKPKAGESDATAKKRVLLESEISEDGKLLAYLGLLVTSDQKRDKVADVMATGATVDDWLEYEIGTAGLNHKEDVMQFVDKMDLTWEQKDAFYRAAGYSENTLDDAPWYHDRYRLPGP